MPANTAGVLDIPLESFGGMVTDLASTDIPEGSSPDNQDVAFQVGLVKTRPGLQNVFTAIVNNPSINYLKTYITQQALLRMLVLDSVGNFSVENPQGVLTGIDNANPLGSYYGYSTTLFSREYIAVGDGKFGISDPRQYDGTLFDRVSQVGPGKAPTVADSTGMPAVNIAAAAGGLLSTNVGLVNLSEVGFVVTVFGIPTTSPTLVGSLLQIGDQIQINAATVAAYNGVWVLTSVSLATDQVQFVHTTSGLAAATANCDLPIIQVKFSGTPSRTVVDQFFVSGNAVIAGAGIAGYDGTWAIRIQPGTSIGKPVITGLTGFLVAVTGAGALGLANSGGGNASAPARISAGVRKVAVCFVTREGNYITAPSPTSQWTAAGGLRVAVTAIPIGPATVIQRILLFTLSGLNSFFYIPSPIQDQFGGTITDSTVINDNTTTTATLNFDDALLAASTPADNLFRKVELGECAGVIDYSSRLFWWGERNKLNNLANPTFDGGTIGGTNPPGWTAGASIAGGASVTKANPTGVAYQITGDGATAKRGQITQSAATDANGVAILAPLVDYSVRARIFIDVELVQGTLHIHLIGTGVNTTGLQLPAASATTSETEYSATITGSSGLATIPTDLLLEIYADGTPTNNGTFTITRLEIYPTLQPNNTSLVRASRVEDPETYDGVNGIMLFGENDGTRITSAFKLRDNLYFVKERSLWWTKDDATNEPSKWSVNQQSALVGTPSVHGVGIGTDWVVIAGREGLYFFDGGEPVKISQEIQKSTLRPDGTTLYGWDSINWQYGHTIWCTVDTLNRRIMVGVPVGEVQKPNLVFVLDYRGLDTGGDITVHKSIHISAYTGKIYDIADSRKWTRWNMTIKSCAIIERTNGTGHVFMGNGAGTGKIYDLLDVENFTTQANFGDDGTAINSYYDTYFFIRPDQEQMFQLGSHRKLFYYLTSYVEGQGTPLFFAFPSGNYPSISLPQSGSTLPNLVTSLSGFQALITAVARTNNVVQITTGPLAHGLLATGVAVVSGVADVTYNGLFGNLKIINPNTFQYPQTGPDSVSSGGNVSPLTRDLEMPINVLTERMKVRVQTNAVGAFFNLRTLTLSLRTDPFAPVRGLQV